MTGPGSIGTKDFVSELLLVSGYWCPSVVGSGLTQSPLTQKQTKIKACYVYCIRVIKASFTI